MDNLSMKNPAGVLSQPRTVRAYATSIDDPGDTHSLLNRMGTRCFVPTAPSRTHIAH